MKIHELNLTDHGSVTDAILSGAKTVETEVVVDLLDADGKVLFTDRGPNEVLIGGAIQIAKDMSGEALPIKVHKLDEALGLPAKTYSGEAPPYIFGLAVGIDGSTGIGSVTPVTRKMKGFNLPQLLPFRITDTSTSGQTNSDDEVNLRDKYCLRVKKGTDAMYYAKFFESKSLYARTVAGVLIGDFPSDDLANIDEDVEAVLEYTCTLTKEECRTYFDRSTGIDSRHISSIMLLRGHRYGPTGFASKNEYHDVIVSNKRNFSMLNLGDSGSVKIRYRLIIK